MERLELGEEPVGLADVEDVVKRGKAVEQRLAMLDRHAPGECDRPAGAGAFPGNQLAELPKDLLLGIGAHGAGDQHRDVGVVERGFWDASDVGDVTRQLLAVSVVHLTSDVPEMDTRRPAERRHLRLAARRPRDQREGPETSCGVAEDRYRGGHRRSLAVCPATHRARPPELADFDDQTDSGALLTVDGNVDERRNAHQVEPARRDIATRYGNGLDRLVDCPGADRLDLDLLLGTHHTGDRAGDGDGLARC